MARKPKVKIEANQPDMVTEHFSDAIDTLDAAFGQAMRSPGQRNINSLTGLLAQYRKDYQRWYMDGELPEALEGLEDEAFKTSEATDETESAMT